MSRSSSRRQGRFTSYDYPGIEEQLTGSAEGGVEQVKIKVGRTPREDLDRVETARRAVGPDVGLFVDANGAYAPKQALALAEEFARSGVTWFEDPVSSDDLDGLPFD